ncbi:hypothetical protein BGZ51_006085 [Haplosporangium sp. Z 767]|nr:hypothetical protein BGZ51_006085 [Haplosporangium sp. Z 767]KAF9182629.1 hypothetical protein BGZ50_004791 [Haplosporangium sp. Z 11]
MSVAIEPTSAPAGSHAPSNAVTGTALLEQVLAQEVKEFHFHVYFFQTNPEATARALRLRSQILDLVSQGYFRVQATKTRTGHEVNTIPRGPHTLGSFEVWCAMEDFARAFQWFALNHGEFSVLIHTLTREEIKDHTTRATWLGQPVPLDFTILQEYLQYDPAQYPELGLGYSAKN